MLSISKKQLETLATKQTMVFQEKLYQEIDQKLSPVDLYNISEKELRTRIDYAISSASDYHITEEYNIIRYSFLVAILGNNFQQKTENNWMVSILESTASANSRLDQISSVVQSI